MMKETNNVLNEHSLHILAARTADSVSSGCWSSSLEQQQSENDTPSTFDEDESVTSDLSCGGMEEEQKANPSPASRRVGNAEGCRSSSGNGFSSMASSSPREQLHRTIAAKKERRAALDFLMTRKASRSSRSGLEWPRRYSYSAPCSPAFTSLRDRLVPEFMLDENGGATDSLFKTSSAPVSPALLSLGPLHPFSTSSPPQLWLNEAAANNPDFGNTTKAPRDFDSSGINSESLNAVDITMESPAIERKVSSVRFDTVQVRSYERILGDNPSCTGGPSMSIGWRYNLNAVLDMSVDEYENHRASSRSIFVPILSRQDREGICKDLGYARSDIAIAVRDATKTRSQRRQTVTNLYTAKAEEAAENTARWLKKGLSIGRNKKSSLPLPADLDTSISGRKQVKPTKGILKF